MSGRRFAFGGDLSSDDTSSEDFQSSSEEQALPPHFNAAAHIHYDEGSNDDIEEEEKEEFVDYEGRDTIQPVSEYKTISIHRPFGLDISHMDKLQTFKNQISLLEQSENRPQSLASDLFQAEDGDYDFDEDEEEYQNSISTEDVREQSEQAEGGAIEVEEPFSQPIVVSEPNENVTKPLEGSSFQNKEIALNDFPQGYQMLRSFRVGWGPNGTFAIPRLVNFGKKENQEMKIETDECPITISKIQVYENTHTTALMHPLHEVNPKKQDFQNELFTLEKHLQFSKETKPERPNDLTYFTVSKPDDLIKVNKKGLSPNDANYQYDAEIWYLVETLWGTPSDIFANIPASEYSHQLYRRNAVGRWFSDTTSSAANLDLQNLPRDLTPEEKECATIFQISEAVDVALQSKDFRFAALVSQAASNNALFKKNIHTQISQWVNAKSFNAINTYRQHIYQILSGDIEGGAKLVDWKRGLALYFWYGRDVTMQYDKLDNLQLALALYNDACKKYVSTQMNEELLPECWIRILIFRSKARLPYPNYLVNSDQIDEIAEVFDTRYHLLQLFCHPADYPIRTVLQPKSYSEHKLNYHLSWHLHKILRAVINHEIIDFHGLEQWNLLDFQETMGHWEWAVYVLLNIYSPIKNSKESLVDLIPKQNPFRPASENKFDSTRIVEHALKEILSRHAPDFVEQPEKRSFLTQKLHIPETWIKAAEATYYHYKKNYRVELTLLLESEQWEAAHSVLMQRLLFQFLLRENTQELMHILEKLSSHTSHLMDWPGQGGLFLNFLKFVENCKILIPNNTKQVNEKLVTELNSMLHKINRWNSNNSFHSDSTKYQRQCCVDEMANTIHSLISTINKKESINSFNRGQIEVQALPNDLVKHHLDILNNHFLHNIKRI